MTTRKSKTSLIISIVICTLMIVFLIFFASKEDFNKETVLITSLSSVFSLLALIYSVLLLIFQIKGHIKKPKKLNIQDIYEELYHKKQKNPSLEKLQKTHSLSKNEVFIECL